MEDLKSKLKKYIEENYIPEDYEACLEEFPQFAGGVCYSIAPNFNTLLEENDGETFSEMLVRLIKESGGKNSEIYNRANIDRRLFSKIVNHPFYLTSKSTALAFAISLKLNYQKTQELLATAGFTLNKKNLGDVIVTFFIDNKIFDIETINESLYEYKQPLIGGGQKFCRSADDHFKTEITYDSDKVKEVLKMANVTEVVFILDKSGSMSGLEKDTIGGFNSMLAKHKNGENAALVSTVLFNTGSEVIHDRLPISEVPELTEEEYFVGGCTALLDAMGDAIKHIKNIHKYARPEDVPSKTIFIITTDGEENSSTRYTYDAITKLVEKQKAKGWDFVFMGANIDAFDVASHLGISANRAVNYHNDSKGTAARFDAMCCFMSDVFSADDMSKVGNKWREKVDEDFESRK